MIARKVDKNIWRGPQPKTDADFTELRKLGVKHILDLETGSHLFNDENVLCAQYAADTQGIRQWNMPLGEIMPPTDKELKMGATFMSAHSDGIYIHCKDGVDRTGIIVAKYRMKYNLWSKSAAVLEMRDLGMHWWFYWWEVAL